MGLSLKESKAIADIARVLEDFLPGSGNQNWAGHISFRSIAVKFGLGSYWQPGTKLPMIVSLLEKTLEHKRGQFQQLIVEVVRRGIVYRRKNGKPVTARDIELLNGLILDVGFKFPELWDPDFLRALDGGIAYAEERVKSIRTVEESSSIIAAENRRRRESACAKFFELHNCVDRQKAGRLLQAILIDIFEISGLDPREPFRVTGEEIDGSFELDNEIYLLEAKWEKEKLSEAPLLVFRGKIEGKSAYTRGLFLSVSGFSIEAKEAIVKGKEPRFFSMEGFDLSQILLGAVELQAYLRKRQRLLAEKGLMFVPFSQMDGS